MGESEEKEPEPSFWERNSAAILYLYLAVAAAVVINLGMWWLFVAYHPKRYQEWALHRWELEGVGLPVLVGVLPYVMVGSVVGKVLKRARLGGGLGLCLLAALLSRICQGWYLTHTPGMVFQGLPFRRWFFSPWGLSEFGFALAGGMLGLVLAWLVVKDRGAS